MKGDHNQIIVTKASGEQVHFSAQKLRESLRKAGANDLLANEVIQKLERELYDGIPTKKIYKLAFAILKKISTSHAARYRLKEAIFELGPTGYAFEKLIGELMQSQGFNVDIGVFVEGHCVKHEVDVVAQSTDTYRLVECKFHHESGIKCDVKIPLYIHARFHDIEKRFLGTPQPKSKLLQGWVVTNTKFSSDAIQYGTCAGLHLLGWNYPRTF